MPLNNCTMEPSGGMSQDGVGDFAPELSLEAEAGWSSENSEVSSAESDDGILPEEIIARRTAHFAKKARMVTVPGRGRGRAGRGRGGQGGGRQPAVKCKQDEDIDIDVECGQCHMEFHSVNALELHMIAHQTQTISNAEDASNGGTPPNATGWKLVGERYECPVCKRTFGRSNIHIEEHMRQHTGEEPFRCNQCGKSFSAHHSLKAHMLKHTGEKPYACEECGNTFVHANSLRLHMAKHTGIRPYECDICGKNFVMLGHLKKHHTIHMEKVLSCHICGNKYPTQKVLDEHMNATHDSSKHRKCNICGKIFVRQYDLRRHIMVHAGDKPFECPHCDKAFTARSDLVRHSVVHTGERPFQCDMCPSRYSCAASLATHRKKHSARKAYTCELCSASFSLVRDLQKHAIVHTGEKPYSCDACGQQFAARKRLKDHMKLHTGECAYVCHVCSKTFATASNLEKHKASHEVASEPQPLNRKMMPYVCNICGKTFANSVNLHKHTLIHEDGTMHAWHQRYVCHICSKTFVEESEMIRHQRAHEDAAKAQPRLVPTGDYGHMCNQCGKMTSDAIGLAHHKRTHEKFRCDICDEGFTAPVLLNRHMAVHNTIPSAKPSTAKPSQPLYTKSYAGNAKPTNTVRTGKRSNQIRTTKPSDQIHSKPSDPKYTTKPGSGQLYSEPKDLVSPYTSIPSLQFGEGQCPVCDKIMPDKAALSAHMTTHTGLKPMHCEICGPGMLFTSSDDYRAHMAWHK